MVDLTHYEFPTSRLLPFLTDTDKQPLVLVACGSFSPITYLHLRMFEMAKDRVKESPRYYLVGGYFSPTADAYNKLGLAAGIHRIKMCQAAVSDSTWIDVDPWEASQHEWQRTALVLDHFNKHINELPKQKDSQRPSIRIMLLAGGDLIESFGTPLLWDPIDLEKIVCDFGCFIVERTGVDLKAFLLSHDILYKHRNNIMICKQYIYNDINSTKIRLFVRRGMSIQYLLPEKVCDYIYEHGLYLSEQGRSCSLTVLDAGP